MAVERASGKQVEAARRLGVTRQSPYNKLKTLDIEVRRGKRRAGGAAERSAVRRGGSVSA